ncbi:MAG: Ig-like domain-containing protein [Deltaproteobacteria bacterium]|nr:Ig-like domain-containing protein [Deltaproteobacteria bacterium]
MPRSWRQGVFFRGLVFFFLLFLLFGCAKKKPHSRDVSDLTPSISPDGNIAEPLPLFPHPQGWKEPASHGSGKERYGLPACLKCHKVSSTTNERTPTCQGCHPLYPHEADWKSKERHGTWVRTNDRLSCATQCHGTDLSGGLTKVSCTKCHEVYPHSSEWKGANFHGEFAKGEGKDLCRSCHGEDLKGGSSGTSCFKCHAIYPHEVGWGEKTKHAPYVLDNGREGCTTQCHGADLNGGLSQIACNRCHTLYPHGEGWQTQHGPTSLELGRTACQGCHGERGERLVAGKNCTTCHADYPHPASATWIPFSGGHGERVRVTYQGETEKCQLCHGADLKKVLKGQNCFSCHPSFAGSHPSGWREFEGHGSYALPVLMRNECRTCHSLTSDSSPRGNRRCGECHNPFPHPEGWRREQGQPQLHGDFVQENGRATCGTARCHGVNLIPDLQRTRGANCNECHSGFPETHSQDNWRGAAGHGAVVLRDGFNNCMTCHNREIAGTAAARPCLQCHLYPHELLPNWETTEHGPFAISDANRQLRCAGCHGTDFQREFDGRNCYSCHTNFPHRSGWTEYEVGTETWTEQECDGADEPTCWDVERSRAANFPSPHAAEYLEQQDNDFPDSFNRCSLCHGTNYAGGNSGRSCSGSGCHENYPHQLVTDWKTDQGGEHTTAYLDGVRGLRSSCTRCHLNFGAGPDGRATSCGSAACHPNYPHLRSPDVSEDQDWVTGSSSARHGDRFNASRVGCRSCHGDDYGGGISTISCYTCHPSYPHSSSTWWRGSGHGVSYSSRFTSATWGEADCGGCHDGSPTAFNETQTRATLVSRSYCYMCHQNYPHVGYEQIVTSGDPPTARTTSYNWEPVVSSTCGSRTAANFGHVLYLLDNNIDSVARGGCGSDGSCHTNGNRSYRTESTCGGVCHSSSRPFPPELPDCNPPGNDQVASGPPAVSSTIPTNGATGVALGTPFSPTTIRITFSEPMLRSTIAPPVENSFVVEKVSDGSRVAGRVACSADWCLTATFSPETPLQPNTQYRGRITTVVTDWGGTPLATDYRWTFTTLTPDTTRPIVNSTVPTNGATDVLTSTTIITVNFNEAMIRASVESSGVFTLSRRNWNSRTRRWEWLSVSGNVHCRTATCQAVDFTIATNARPLREETVYRATVTTNAQDLAGNRLATNHVWTFTTEGFE